MSGSYALHAMRGTVSRSKLSKVIYSIKRIFFIEVSSKWYWDLRDSKQIITCDWLISQRKFSGSYFHTFFATSCHAFSYFWWKLCSRNLEGTTPNRDIAYTAQNQWFLSLTLNPWVVTTKFKSSKWTRIKETNQRQGSSHHWCSISKPSYTLNMSSASCNEKNRVPAALKTKINTEISQETKKVQWQPK